MVHSYLYFYVVVSKELFLSFFFFGEGNLHMALTNF